jgi:hypothetical protein
LFETLVELAYAELALQDASSALTHLRDATDLLRDSPAATPRHFQSLSPALDLLAESAPEEVAAIRNEISALREQYQIAEQ